MLNDDVHFWTEVRLSNGTWIALEPSPGYTLPVPPQTLWAQIQAVIGQAVHWVRQRLWPLLSLAALLSLTAWFRHDLTDKLATAWWRVRASRSDVRRSLLQALNLLERRAKFAGSPRPRGRTPRRWYRELAGVPTPLMQQNLDEFLVLADWAAHAPAPQSVPAPQSERSIRDLMQTVLRDWTLAKFRRIVRATQHAPAVSHAHLAHPVHSRISGASSNSVSAPQPVLNSLKVMTS